jgi:hypothetical protein
VLFSAASVQDTFKLIDTLIFPDHFTLIVRGVLLPALTAAAYIFLYPYPAKIVFEFTRNWQKEINDIRRRIENETPLTLEESRKIRSEVIRIEDKHSSEIDRKNRDIDRLKEEVASLRSSSFQSEVNSTSKDEGLLEATQFSILQHVERLKSKAPEKTLIQKSPEPQVKVEFDLEVLVQRQFLTRTYSYEVGDYIYGFTHEGRSYLLKHRDEKA